MIKRVSRMQGTIGYAVTPLLGETVPGTGEQIFELLFIDQETGEEWHVTMTEASCKDLGAKLQGGNVLVAPAGALNGLHRNGAG